jgi:hypothetical protein
MLVRTNYTYLLKFKAKIRTIVLGKYEYSRGKETVRYILLEYER